MIGLVADELADVAMRLNKRGGRQRLGARSRDRDKNVGTIRQRASGLDDRSLESNTSVGHSRLLDHIQDRLHQARRALGKRFDLDVDEPVEVRGQTQGLGQCRSAGPGPRDRVCLLPVAIEAPREPGPRVKRVDLGPVEIQDTKAAGSAASPAYRAATSVVRTSVSSCTTTATPSRVSWTSSSQASALACQPSLAASSVFSGSKSRSTSMGHDHGPAAIRCEQVKKPVRHDVPRWLADGLGAINVRRHCSGSGTHVAKVNSPVILILASALPKPA